MDFLEAAEIAKKNPGSHFTRGESGLFVVYLKDGRIVTSPHHLSASAEQAKAASQDAQPDTSGRLERLESIISSLHRQLEASNLEIRQLRLEVNDLKDSIARIPASEWSRYQEEQRKLDEQRRREERDRIVGLARKGQLSCQQLGLVADNVTSLGITGTDLEFIRAEVIRTRPKPLSRDSFVIHATTDGQ